MAEVKKFLSYDGLGKVWTKIKKNFIPFGQTIENNNCFGARRLLIQEIDNAFWAGEKRFTVSVNGSTELSTIKNLFNNCFENSVDIPAGETSVINIRPGGGSSYIFPGLPYGIIKIAFYYTSIPESISARTYVNYQQHTVGWHDIVLEEVSTASNNRLYQGRISWHQISDIEISITASSSTICRCTQILYYLDRPSVVNQLEGFSKASEQILYYNLTAPKFIKSGGTSNQFLKADGSVDSNTYLTTIEEMGTTEINNICV